MVCGMEERLSKLRWIEEGLEALRASGPEGLKIETLCIRLNVTKGSFYHHFKNLADYKSALLKHWEATSREGIISSSSRGDTAEDRLKSLERLAAGTSGKQEAAIRSWALQDQAAASYQRRIDGERRKAIEELYREVLPPEEARSMATLALCLIVGSQQLMTPVSGKETKRMLDLVSRGPESLKSEFEEERKRGGLK